MEIIKKLSSIKCLTITVLLFLQSFQFAYCQKRILYQTLQEGISNYHIKSICQDSKGFMWFGTHDGLNKFDGNKFVIYENSSSDTNSLSSNFINAIVEDNSNNIWVGTSNGVDIYNRDKDNFSQFEEIKNIGPIYVSNLYADVYDNIWICLSGYGLMVYNTKSHNFSHYVFSLDDENSVNSNFITGVVRDNKDRVWIGTRNGLDLFDEENKTFTHFMNDEKDPNSLSQNRINSITIDNEGDIWLGTYGGGLNKMQEADGKITFKHYINDGTLNGLSNNYILSLCPDKKGNLWIGTENGGLNYLNKTKDEFSYSFAEDGNPNALTSNSIWDVYEDRNGIIWIGTYNKGINIYDENFDKFELFQKNNTYNTKLVNNDVNCFAKDDNGLVWIATDGGGLCGFDPVKRQFMEFPDNDKLSSKSVMTLLIDDKGEFWAGTWAYGIDRFDRKGRKLKNYKCTTRKNYAGNISCLYQDTKGRIFAGTSGNGLFYFDTGKDEFVPIINERPISHLNTFSFVSDIQEDSRERLWVGTFHGLIMLTSNNIGGYDFVQYMHEEADSNSISGFQIRGIYENSEKKIWVGTDNGLNLLLDDEKGVFKSFTKLDGLINNSINSILEDNQKNLWLATNKGLTEFNPGESTFKNFTKQDGLSTNEFTVGSNIKLSSGTLIFGGSNGFNMFDPDNIKKNLQKPLVYITNLKISNKDVEIGGENSPLEKHILETEKIVLTHKQSSFALDFVAINYTRSSKNQYKYKLDGFDEDWINSGTRHTATYTNLDAGKYTFMAMGSNNDGVWNEEPVTLGITVLPPLWKTTVAYVVYVILFTIVLFGFLRLWMIKTEQSQKLKFQKIQREHEEGLNKMKIQFFTNVSHELRTPLTLIVSPLEDIVSSKGVSGKLKQQLSIVFKNAQRLFKLVNELMDFTKFEENKLKLFVKQFDIVKFAHELYYLFSDEAKLKNIHYTFNNELNDVYIWADKSKLEKVFLNLLANAFKYTPENGFVRVRLYQDIDPGKVNAEVINSGPGISSQYIDKIFDRFFQVPENEANGFVGTGIGLALVKNVIDMHRGEVSVSSEINKQTCFRVSLNLGKDHFEEADIINNGSIEHGNNRDSTKKYSSAENESKNNKPLVLVVEDNADLRTYIESILNEDYDVICATDGEKGLKLSLENSPDLIVSDIVMPVMNGMDLCKKIKEDINTSHIPVVLLTSKSNIESQIEGIETGADMYITKPFNVAHLKVAIRKLIETRRKLFRQFSQDAYLMPKEISTNKYDQEFLEQTIEYINKNIEKEDIGVEGLSSYLMMNRSNVYRKIKALTGQSATEFIRTIKLKMSIKYLESGDYNISEISYKVGFTSPAYFTKCFKDQFGKLPSGYLPKKKSEKQ